MNNIIITTIEEKDGVYTLIRNDKAAICPFRTPIVLPSQLQGQLQVMPHSCNSQCPHFNFSSDGMINFSCGNGKQLDPAETESEESNKIII